MPLGIAIGRYSEHVKISTECHDDVESPDGDNEPWPVQYIGQQNIPLYNSKNISGMMYQIYNKNYSRINSLINLKKYELTVDTSGISVFLASSKKGTTKNLFMSYSLTDILLVTTDYQHDQLFAIIFYGPLRNCVLHLYLCNSEDDVRNIMNKCNEDFANNREIKQIDRSTYSDGLEVIHYKPYEKANDIEDEPEQSLTEVLRENGSDHRPDEIVNESLKRFKEKNTPLMDITKFRIPYDNVDVEVPQDCAKNNDDPFSFGDFQMVQTTTTTTKTSVPSNSLPDSPQEKVSCTQTSSNKNVNLMDDDDLEDEFAELALKRNIYMPNHLQDKSIESTLLFPTDFSQSSNEQRSKPGFFSSYNKLQS